MNAWQRLSEIVRFDSWWLRLIGEHWRSDKGEELEYWRVEKADSVGVLPVQNGRLYCVRPTFRPGIQRATMDSSGGRLPAGQRPKELALSVLERELGLPARAIGSITALNHEPWMINSTFSNQSLWGLAAEIKPEWTIPPQHVGQSARADAQGVAQLLDALDCLQCRGLARMALPIRKGVILWRQYVGIG